MTLEFQNELGDFRTFTTKPRQKNVDIQPLKTGDTAPFFSLAGGSGDWRASIFNYPKSGSGQSVSLLDLVAEKPVVISFYCPCWGRYAGPYLDSLIRLNDALQQVGAELVVLSIESPKVLAKQGKNLDFLFAHDADQQVSRQFGVYNEDSPVWDRVSGISDEAFIPAVYVVGPDRQIEYHFLDENFDTPIDIDTIVSHVWALSPVDTDFIDKPVGRQNVYAQGFFALWLLGFLAAAGSQFINP
ncbi:redoxin domain-containing protein [Spirosoma endbachense]|uniref:Redoxin domain-containing protein n=1 Tax=Spirosoma endbachense TaxID=2666025 RepID=A0A6P1VTP7_9BACT|nr:redoxin domain-containing protein [Spirosoma endbachense]QHV95107.1 redoxin domain-containing protein [Spirosoma endbachense]